MRHLLQTDPQEPDGCHHVFAEHTPTPLAFNASRQTGCDRHRSRIPSERTVEVVRCDLFQRYAMLSPCGVEEDEGCAIDGRSLRCARIGPCARIQGESRHRREHSAEPARTANGSRWNSFSPSGISRHRNSRLLDVNQTVPRAMRQGDLFIGLPTTHSPPQIEGHGPVSLACMTILVNRAPGTSR